MSDGVLAQVKQLVETLSTEEKLELAAWLQSGIADQEVHLPLQSPRTGAEIAEWLRNNSDPAGWDSPDYDGPGMGETKTPTVNFSVG